MRIAIIGSRNSGNTNFAEELEKRITFKAGDIIVSGGARGIDSFAARYASEHGLGLIEHLPDYQNNGRGATFIRNRKIVDSADLLIAFWDGESRGTKYTIDYAKRKGVECLIVYV